MQEAAFVEMSEEEAKACGKRSARTAELLKQLRDDPMSPCPAYDRLACQVEETLKPFAETATLQLVSEGALKALAQVVNE